MFVHSRFQNGFKIVKLHREVGRLFTYVKPPQTPWDFGSEGVLSRLIGFFSSQTQINPEIYVKFLNLIKKK